MNAHAHGHYPELEGPGAEAFDHDARTISLSKILLSPER